MSCFHAKNWPRLVKIKSVKTVLLFNNMHEGQLLFKASVSINGCL